VLSFIKMQIVRKFRVPTTARASFLVGALEDGESMERRPTPDRGTQGSTQAVNRVIEDERVIHSFSGRHVNSFWKYIKKPISLFFSLALASASVSSYNDHPRRVRHNQCFGRILTGLIQFTTWEAGDEGFAAPI